MTTSSVAPRRASPSPDRVAVSRMAAVLRGAGTAVVIVAAVLGAVPPVSYGVLAVTLAGFVGWTTVYVVRSWTGRLSPVLALGDVAVAACLFVPFTQIMPPEAARARFNWVVLVASMVIVAVPACGRVWLGPPAGLVLATCLVAVSRAAGAPGGGWAQALIVVAQSLVSAVVFTIVGRAGVAAREAFAALRAAEREAEISRAHRADELSQLRLLHNGALTTLTMAVHNGDRRPSALLRRRAAIDLVELPRLGTPDGDAAGGAPMRLDVRIARVIETVGTRLTVRYAPEPVEVPGAVADAVTSAVAEALENVARHAGVPAADVRVRARADGVHVEVSDDGAGFEASSTDRGFGLREVIGGQVRAVGGTADVVSRPGGGTTVTLEWRRG